MDVNVEIDELVLDGDVNSDVLAGRIAAAAGGALSPDVAAQVGRAVLDEASGARASAEPGGTGRRP